MRAFPPTAAVAESDTHVYSAHTTTNRCTFDVVCGGVGPHNQRQYDKEGYPRRLSPAPSRKPTSPIIPRQHQTAQRNGSEKSCHDRNSITHSKGCCTTSKSLYSRFLLSHFRRTQGLGRVAPSHRPKSTQQVCALPALSHAYSALVLKRFKRWRLGMFLRSKGRLPPCSNTPRQLQISALCGNGTVLEFRALPFGLNTAPHLFTRLAHATGDMRQ